MKLNEIRNIKGKIHLVTGLHIGGSKDNIEIGGMDQPIIKHPLTKEPYIPGSSLKGKMRSLLEVLYFSKRDNTYDDVLKNGKPCGCGQPDCLACKIFGSSSDKKDPETGPTRIIVRDSNLTDDYREKFSRGDLPMEEKYENTIHRVKGTADNPRPLERVPAGVEFGLNISFKVFEGDDDSLFDFVFKGLKLIQLDAIGGNSSRGCGQIEFIELSVNGEKKPDNYLETIEI